jgi:hypothetical protein
MTELGTQTPGQAPPPRAQATHGEPCQECGAPLAADQRYCLNCGCRRGDPRVDYRHYMAPPQAPFPPAPADDRSIDPTTVGSTDQAAKKERDYAPLAAVGGIAVLGLMLLVGVLIGKGGDNSAPAPAPVVVRGGGEGETASTGEGENGSNSAKSAKGGSGKSGAKQKGESLTGGGGGKEEEPVQASDEALESLHSQSGADYEEQSKKLPNKIATPGAPPPIDKTKPPGGGEGGAEVIK